MSVLKIDREQSSVQFVTTAIELLKATLSYTALLSNRRWRVVGDRVVNLAQDLAEYVTRANGIFPSTVESTKLRLQYLWEASGVLNSLGIFLNICCESLYENPQGSFVSKSTSQPYDAEKCRKKIDSMSANIGNLLNTESALISGQIEKYKNSLSQ